MSVDILGTSWDQCRSMVQYCFTSTETRRLVRTDSPGRPPRLSHSSRNMNKTNKQNKQTKQTNKDCFYRSQPSSKQVSSNKGGSVVFLFSFLFLLLFCLFPVMYNFFLICFPSSPHFCVFFTIRSYSLCSRTYLPLWSKLINEVSERVAGLWKSNKSIF